MDKAIVTVKVNELAGEYEVEIPIDVTVKEICAALSKALNLERKGINITGYYIKTENPIGFLKGSDMLKKYNIGNGSTIILI